MSKGLGGVLAISRKERVLRAIRRGPLDRLPTQANYTQAMGELLSRYFQVPVKALPELFDNHLLRVDVSYRKRTSENGDIFYDWWGAGWDTRTEGYWHAQSPLAERRDLTHFTWPDPEDPDLLRDAIVTIETDGADAFVVPNFGMCLFERAWSLRGFDQFLIDMIEDPGWSEELLDRITDIQIALAKRFVAAGVDGGYFGDDYGAQQSMLFSPRLWRRLLRPRLQKIFAVFHDKGLPIIFHSDGDIRPILPDLVDIGVSMLNPVQPEVLAPEWLQKEFGNHLSFYGGISTQGVLPTGTPDEVCEATRICAAKLAPHGTGLLLGPSHRMQSDIPAVNVKAMLSSFRKAAYAS